ncbi:hypothetical protein FQZ97_1215710 [compost metagenome]
MIDGAAVLALEFPTLRQHQRIDDRDRDQLLELLQLAEDQRAVGPGAGKRDVEVVAPGFGLEAAFARWACRSV